MPKIGDMIESKFLKKEDVGDGKLLVISGIKQYNVAMQGAEQDMKWCAEFNGDDKPLVLNSTNLHLLEASFGSDDTDDWVGKAIVVYNDPSVSFGGKITGGVRVDVKRTKRYHAKQEQAPAMQTIQAQMSNPQPSRNALSDLDDDISF